MSNPYDNDPEYGYDYQMWNAREFIKSEGVAAVQAQIERLEDIAREKPECADQLNDFAYCLLMARGEANIAAAPTA